MRVINLTYKLSLFGLHTENNTTWGIYVRFPCILLVLFVHGPLFFAL